jgi:hypothetical protein
VVLQKPCKSYKHVEINLKLIKFQQVVLNKQIA